MLPLSHTPRAGSIPAWAGEPADHVIVFPELRVYPRVGGGTEASPVFLDPVEGLSPRGRGNRFPVLGRFGWRRSIPAWAGEPLLRLSSAISPGVYPRVGGGTAQGFFGADRCTGLSPRGRGNPADSSYFLLPPGSIPAWAGEPLEPYDSPTHLGVYPRVGGGTDISGTLTSGYRGLSPRGRGNPTYLQVKQNNPQGLSPRGRGNRSWTGSRTGSLRSIPAWAGEPLPPAY